MRRLTPCLLVCCLAALCLAQGAAAAPSPNPEKHPFGIVPGSFQLTPSTLAAGAHEDLTVSFDFNHSAAGQSYGDVKGTVVELPAGFVGNNTAVPTCTPAQLATIPIRRGRVASHGTATASNAPAASSETRGNGEKYAAVALSVVWYCDQASEPTIIAARATPRVSRSDHRLATVTRSMISSGQTT